MHENISPQSTMTELFGQSLFEVWQELCLAIDEKYEMESLQKSHIHAKSLGGTEKADNMFLLCPNCYVDSPDTAPKEEEFSPLMNPSFEEV